MTENQPPYPPFLSAPSPKPRKAVALEYERGKDAAPRITATGQGHVAEQILQIAFANGVKVREDADLVEILSVLDIDSVIPVEAYAAVGEILSYVYRANARAGSGKIQSPASGAESGEDDR